MIGIQALKGVGPHNDGRLGQSVGQLVGERGEPPHARQFIFLPLPDPLRRMAEPLHHHLELFVSTQHRWVTEREVCIDQNQVPGELRGRSRSALDDLSPRTGIKVGARAARDEHLILPEETFADQMFA
jgi:hypothetical protein